MNVIISKGKAQGTIIAPPSKSVAHRMLICGGLANASSVECSSLFIPFLCGTAVCNHAVVITLLLLRKNSLGG